MKASHALARFPLTRKPPRLADSWRALLRADFIVQWHQRRSLLMTLLVPVAFLFSFRSSIPAVGAHAVLAICISIGLPTMGLMGYPMTIARDRETGVFQRIRATPTPTSAIMGSRIVVQLAVMILMTLSTCGFAHVIDGISLGAGSLALLMIAAMLGGSAFLALGQVVAALIKSAEVVSAVGRLIYLTIAVVGSLGVAGMLGPTVKRIVIFSPIGTSRALLLAAMSPASLDLHAVAPLAATVGYCLVFATIGVRWFKWSAD